jgi:RNA polymerase sigma-70 factor (ECF subfamily)
VAKKIHEFKSDPERGSFKGWLLKLTRWRIIDQIRKRKPHQQVSAGARSDDTRTATINRVPDPDSLDVDCIWELEWQRNLADAALEIVKGRIKPRAYQIYDFHILRGWSAPKVAKHLGVSMVNVYITAHRISKQLKQEVERLEKTM